MAKVTAKLEGFERTMKALEAAPEVARTHASSAVASSSFAVAQRARSLVPVDTGRLRDSINSSRVSARSLVGRVGLDATAGYWYFVEFGTVKMPARPFFRPAAELEREAFIQRMRAIGPAMERDLSSGRFG